MRRHFTALVIITLLILTTAPFIYAAIVNAPESVFAGMLQNPIDGASYLAKMRQGWAGAWLFHLPYTAGELTGQPIFLYYLFLGHLARWTGGSLVLVFHLARIAGAGLMTLALIRFFKEIMPDTPGTRLTVALASFGVGMGWLVFLFVGMTSDFWVSEAYPFLSAYTNPHFPLGLAILLWLLSGQNNPASGILEKTRFILGAALLAIIFPFAVVVLLVVQAGVTLWDAVDTKRLLWKRTLLLAAGGLPYLIYQYFVIQSDPLLKDWNLQNLTPSPPLWDILVSFSPALIFAVFGVFYIIRKGYSPGRILVVWVVAAVILLVIPFNLQRRFMLGLFIPMAGLAVFGLNPVYRIRFIKRYGGMLLMIMSIPTLLIVLLSGLSGIDARDPHLYLNRDEFSMMEWMLHNVPSNAVILAAPDTGLFIPAWGGQQVLYGHPFETVNADAKVDLVKSALRGEIQLDRIENQAGVKVDYLFWGPREEEYSPSPPAGLAVAHQVGKVILFKLR